MRTVYSTTVIFFYVQLNSCVTSQPQGCPSGYFGASCKYKCRCTRDMCDVNGSCLGSDTCLAGWFGPACQYADIAYGQPAGHYLTDGDDRTCRDYSGGTGSVTLNLPESYPFTWLRVHVNSTEAVSNLQVTFNNTVSCNNPRSAPVDGQTWDIYCSMDEFVLSVTLTGPAASSLCSIYISGGRDIAFNEYAQQTDTYQSYSARLSVDGNVNPNFNAGHCSATIGLKSTQDSWSVTFSQARIVNRYAIYSRTDDRTYRLQGFLLQSFDGSTRVFNYTNSQAILPVYTVKHGHLQMTFVQITSANSDKVVEMCEVEIYGDSICADGQYGRECEHTCNCDGGQPCFASTGGCPSGCASGSHGENCWIPCSPGKHGPGCLTNCSEFCTRDTTGVRSCDRFNGTCNLGCEDGYLGSNCILHYGSPAGPDNRQLIGIIVGCLFGVIIVAVIIAAGIIVFRRRQATKIEIRGDESRGISLSRYDRNEAHRTLSDGVYEIPEVSTAVTQIATQMGSQGKIESEDIVADDSVAHTCDDSDAHTCDNSVVHTYDDIVAHTYDGSLAQTYEEIDDNLASPYEAVLDDSNKDITFTHNCPEYANTL